MNSNNFATGGEMGKLSKNDFEKIEDEAFRKLKPQKPQMKISGKSNFLLAKLSGQKKAKK